jgi:hypothetical protein
MLGDFERDWFDQPLTLFMFFAYTFIANIMMLNVLIAVVSDSYEHAMIKSKFLFRRARLELVAEFDTMFTCWDGTRRLQKQREREREAARNGGYAELDAPDPDLEAPTPGIWLVLKRLGKPLARAIKMGRDENDGEDTAWPGRALDMERRVAALIHDYEVRAQAELDMRLAASEVRIIDAVRRMNRGLG